MLQPSSPGWGGLWDSLCDPGFPGTLLPGTPLRGLLSSWGTNCSSKVKVRGRSRPQVYRAAPQFGGNRAQVEMKVPFLLLKEVWGCGQRAGRGPFSSPLSVTAAALGALRSFQVEPGLRHPGDQRFCQGRFPI